ncbi:butyrate kinase [Prevotella sp. OH937_COT-195]|uniref:butyrate kinase n=1 Tax=Prevotella sp. OH937_COT-195 TaxID=2491051 RepID=UPI000F64C1CD|nr:butyrate kinase [Prevotella sp. OH937_COT-195]RRC97691.1 butyrate kinase [Prevotella sp. OH937_COT-195]
MKILAVNPGMISTKFGVFEDEKMVMKECINHPYEELCKYPNIMDEFDYRKDTIVTELKNRGYDMNFDVIVGRGGLVKPIESGVYELNDKVIEDTKHPRLHHACNLGSLIALAMAKDIPGCRAFTVDPGVVDELDDVARITGIPETPHRTIWHALNQREIAKRHCRENGLKYEEQDLIVCHLGSGISFAMHHHGRAIECCDALSGDGPFSPSRAGAISPVDIIRLCFCGKYNEEEMLRKINGHSGLTAHLGTNDVREVEKRINEGDKHAKLVLDAMIYSIARHLASLAPATYGHVDAVILTGAIAHSKYVSEGIKKRIEYLAPVFVYPGEDELAALANNAYRALKGEEKIKIYE